MDAAFEIARGLGSLALKIFLIVMPLLMFLEWARTRRWFDRFIQSSNHLFAPVGFRPPALFPLMTGILFGISYGAGVLIPQSQSGHISRRQVFLIALFLCLCHAIVEDTLLFVVVGANPWVLVITRFVAAMLIVYIFSRLAWPIRPEPEEVATEHV
ncbi:MAG TPA: nucleoside recognition protein [bacterium]|nr:nucleoside recognition protein [bacterium]